jgi:hypothetical protein
MRPDHYKDLAQYEKDKKAHFEEHYPEWSVAQGAACGPCGSWQTPSVQSNYAWKENGWVKNYGNKSNDDWHATSKNDGAQLRQAEAPNGFGAQLRWYGNKSNDRVDDLENNVAEAMDRIAELEKAKEADQSRIQQLEQVAAEAMDRIVALKNAKEADEDRIAELEKAQEACQSRIQQLERFQQVVLKTTEQDEQVAQPPGLPPPA